MNKNLCNCIALYDFNTQAPILKEWVTYMEKWLEDIGYFWETMGLSTSPKLLNFLNGKKKLEERDSKSITELELYGEVSKAGTNDHWKVKSYFGTKTQDQLLYICFDDNIKKFDEEYLYTLIRDLSNFCKFKYGICYQREFNKGPDWYASGVIEGLGHDQKDKLQRSKITCWNHTYFYKDGGYHTGILRDIYPLNILSKAHLDNKVENQSLEYWIKSSNEHGELKPLTNTLWSWWVPEKNISKIRKALHPTGFVVCA